MKQHGGTLQLEHDFAESLLETAQVIVLVLDTNGRIIYLNPYMERISGYVLQEVKGQSWFDVFLPKRDRQRIRALFSKAIGDISTHGTVNPIVTKDGREIDIEWYDKTIKDSNGTVTSLLSIGHDITVKKNSEQKINKLLKMQEIVRQVNGELINPTDEKTLFHNICNLVVSFPLIRFVWIGKLDENTREIMPFAKAGHENGFLDSFTVKYDDSVYGCGPSGTAVKTKRPCVISDVRIDDSCQPWREKALERGFLSTISIPIIEDREKVIGIINLCSSVPNFFEEDEIRLLKEVSDNIAVGMRALRLEQRVIQTIRDLENILDGTVRAISSIGEIRDPYTAGHERKVAQLSVAIARKLGFSEKQQEGIHITGFLHDIGKIAVPIEILVKPARLEKNEFNIIRTHPRIGYDILKHIDFPYPVAKAVLQHHERLNGVGYPDALNERKILTEARIIMVADVVEAMASNRPYRRALGIERAVDEIIKNRGILYDPEVVDACISILTEGFKFLNV